MSLKGIAQETLRICEQGEYVAPSGRRVSIRDALAHAVEGSLLYEPDEAIARPARVGDAGPTIEVTAEKTGAAARRLFEGEGIAEVAALNFASAKNPGGGFVGGAKAQEEDLARCSGLYPCLSSQWGYYEANRAEPSMLYTDHVIYSPRVPFFRDEALDLLEAPFLASILTAPAPNAGEHLRREPRGASAIREVLRARAKRVLRIAAAQGERTLVLGAWGCGVFRNDPAECADAFGLALDALHGAFDRVVFAVYERGGDGPNLRAFQARFGSAIPRRSIARAVAAEIVGPPTR